MKPGEETTPTTKQLFWSTTIISLVSTWPFIVGVPVPYLVVVALVFMDSDSYKFLPGLISGDKEVLIVVMPLLLSVCTAYLFSKVALRYLLKLVGDSRVKRYFIFLLLSVFYLIAHYFFWVCLIILLDKLNLVSVLQA